MKILNLDIIYNCKEATRLVVKSEQIKINFSDRLKMYIHLLFCKYCRLFKKQNIALKEFLDKEERYDEWVEKLAENFQSQTKP